MQKLFSAIFLLTGIFFAPNLYALAQQTGPTTSVIAPAGGECFKGGSSAQISWTLDRSANHAYVSYHGGDSNNPIFGAPTNIPGGHPAGGSALTWTTPAITASDLKIYLESHNANHGRIGSGAYSGVFSIDSSGPSAPVLSRKCVFPACGGAVATNEIIWSVSTDAGCKGLAGYEIFRNGKHIGYSQVNSFTDTNITAGTDYQYKVAAYDDFAFTDSNVISVTTGQSATPPVSPAPSASPTPTQPTPSQPVSPTLKIAKSGNGSGTVTATGINCGDDCEQNYPAGTMVTLNATPDATSKFTGWAGDCLSIGTHTCQTTMAGSKTVTAKFTKVKLYTLTIVKTGSGDGAVTNTPAGLDCGAVCSVLIKEGTVVFLQAAADWKSDFKNWTGDCLGIGKTTCKTTMSGNRTITAKFDAAQMYMLTIEKNGDGSGVVTGAGGGINCGSECKKLFKKDSTFTLKATAKMGGSFDYWTGDCLGIGSGVCQIIMDKDKTITFFFNSQMGTVYKIAGGIVAAGALAFGLRRLFKRKHIGVPK